MHPFARCTHAAVGRPAAKREHFDKQKAATMNKNDTAFQSEVVIILNIMNTFWSRFIPPLKRHSHSPLCGLKRAVILILIKAHFQGDLRHGDRIQLKRATWDENSTTDCTYISTTEAFSHIDEQPSLIGYTEMVWKTPKFERSFGGPRWEIVVGLNGGIAVKLLRTV